MSKAETFAYRPDGKVLRSFFVDRSPVSIIQGPVGSGTSTACCHKMWSISMEQKPDRLNIRKSRWLVVRNTFDELKQTTLKTWSYWFGEGRFGDFGTIKMSNPPEHKVRYDLPDGTTVQAEFIFLSLDNDDDVSKLLSMECTGVWFNEVQFSEKKVFDMAHSRAMQGRYPPKLDGGPTWKGVIADLNAPREGHWIPYMRGDVPLPLEWDEDRRREYNVSDNWKFYTQPPGLIEIFKNKRLDHYVENNRETREMLGLEDLDAVAENMNWIDEPYMSLIDGKDKDYIDTYVMNRVGLYRKGQAVFPSFVRETHISKDPIPYRPEWPLIVGLDFARNPAAVICQLIRGQMLVLDEFGSENVSAGEFAPLLRQRILEKFPGVLTAKPIDLERYTEQQTQMIEDRISKISNPKIQFWGDPTGGSKGQGTNWTPYLIFGAHGMPVVRAPGNNDIVLRLEAVKSLLSKMIQGAPALLLSPVLRTLKAGMGGAYHFAKIQGQAGRYHDVPYKDTFSDYCDALQYACLGAGMGMAALNPGGAAPKPSKRDRKKYSLRNKR